MTDINKLNLSKYDVISVEKLEDLDSTGLLLRHKKSGARIAIVSNDDNNKVFSIGFKTPPYNDTGLQHILEHSTLCGSRKYPVKDPFVELCKGSLNTFLNAMTYPDKTVYPVASCNDVDFKNIMDVYMDAVFYPDIYNKPQIFKQEGWHYELENIRHRMTCFQDIHVYLYFLTRLTDLSRAVSLLIFLNLITMNFLIITRSFIIL